MTAYIVAVARRAGLADTICVRNVREIAGRDVRVRGPEIEALAIK